MFLLCLCLGARSSLQGPVLPRRCSLIIFLWCSNWWCSGQPVVRVWLLVLGHINNMWISSMQYFLQPGCMWVLTTLLNARPPRLRKTAERGQHTLSGWACLIRSVAHSQAQTAQCGLRDHCLVACCDEGGKPWHCGERASAANPGAGSCSTTCSSQRMRSARRRRWGSGLSPTCYELPFVV